MNYLERLREAEKKQEMPATPYRQNRQNPVEEGFGGFVSTPPGPFEKNSDPETDRSGVRVPTRQQGDSLTDRTAGPSPLQTADIEAIREAIEERAAIREFDGGEDRATAEREARSAMRVFRFRLADRPDTWLTMLAPGCDLDAARHTLRLRFGAERVADVVERGVEGAQ